MRHFLVYTNRHKDKNLVLTKKICDYLRQKGQKATVKTEEGDFKERISTDTDDIPADIPRDVDCMIVLGGDGFTGGKGNKEAAYSHYRCKPWNIGVYDGD